MTAFIKVGATVGGAKLDGALPVEALKVVGRPLCEHPLGIPVDAPELDGLH